MSTIVLILALSAIAYFGRLWLRRLDIRHEGDLYLRRFHLVRLPDWMPWPFWWRRAFLHYIRRPDQDRHPHNHPWSKARAYILSGGYDELITLAGKTRAADLEIPARRLAGDTSRHAFGEGAYHRITSVRPRTWTLFLAGRRDREWSFLTEDGPVDWRTYLKLPADAELRD